MATLVKGVNPRILRWARERSGYSLEDVAQSLDKEVATIESWESGDSAPTYNQLEKLAYQLYKRPLAIFFFPAPPSEPDAAESFRTLPEFEVGNLLPDSRYAVRLAMSMQIALAELNDGVNPCPRLIFRDIRTNTQAMTPSHVARGVRQYLGISVDEQSLWRSPDVALEKWRDVVQEHGIFVFKRSFKQEDVSGICLHDDEFPVMYLNNSTATTRQVFTIFHELGHILLGTNGVTKRDTQYIDSLTGEARKVETFCNEFAAEYLVPSDDFDRHLRETRSMDRLLDLNSRYKVSREVILRKLLDRGMVSPEDYEALAQQWIQEYRENRKGVGGGNYYSTQATYLGKRYLELAFSRYYEGRCTMQQLASYLNVKVRSVAGLEQAMLGKMAL